MAVLSVEAWDEVLRRRAEYSAWNMRVTCRLVTCPATYIERIMLRHNAREQR